MISQFFIVLLFSLASAALYRMGGIGKPFNTKYRDAGVPVAMVLMLLCFGQWHWSLILCFGALWGALTTYNKWVGYFFNRKDKSTVYWESWLVTGLFYALAMLPFVIFHTHSYIGFFLYTILVSSFCCLWSEAIGLDWLEEGGRGFVILAAMPLLFI